MIGFLRDVVRVLGMPCREHTALFSRQLDEPLPRGVAAGLRIHIVYCGGCRRFRAQVRRLRDLARLIGGETESGEGLPEAVRDRVLRRAADESRKIR
ncbi:MAG: hypothetical protein ACK4WH_12990 [Phycisphaerales bacterium]